MSAIPRGGYGCWVGGCSTIADYQVVNPLKPLLTPVESCSAHVGDLLGNIAKSATGGESTEVTIKVTRLV